MHKETPKLNDGDNATSVEEPKGFASPPCQRHEIDPAYGSDFDEDIFSLLSQGEYHNKDMDIREDLFYGMLKMLKNILIQKFLNQRDFYKNFKK